jgi:hypothetical protein
MIENLCVAQLMDACQTCVAITWSILLKKTKKTSRLVLVQGWGNTPTSNAPRF